MRAIAIMQVGHIFFTREYLPGGNCATTFGARISRPQIILQHSRHVLHEWVNFPMLQIFMLMEKRTLNVETSTF